MLVPKLGVGVHGVPRGQESYLQSPAGLASCLPVNVLCSLHTLPHIHLPMSPRILARDALSSFHRWGLGAPRGHIGTEAPQYRGT